eukprot:s303_g11.t1
MDAIIGPSLKSPEKHNYHFRREFQKSGRIPRGLRYDTGGSGKNHTSTAVCCDVVMQDCSGSANHGWEPWESYEASDVWVLHHMVSRLLT